MRKAENKDPTTGAYPLIPTLTCKVISTEDKIESQRTYHFVMKMRGTEEVGSQIERAFIRHGLVIYR